MGLIPGGPIRIDFRNTALGIAQRNRAGREKPAQFVQLLQQVNKSILQFLNRAAIHLEAVGNSRAHICVCCLSPDGSLAPSGTLPGEVRKSIQRALILRNDLNTGLAPDEVVLITFYTYLLSSLAGSSFPSLDKDREKQQAEYRELKRHDSTDNH